MQVCRAQVTDLSYTDSSLQPEQKWAFIINHIVGINLSGCTGIAWSKVRAYENTLTRQDILRAQRLSPKSQPILEAGFYLECAGLEQLRCADITLSCTSCDQRKREISSNDSVHDTKEQKGTVGPWIYSQLCPGGCSGWEPQGRGFNLLPSTLSLKVWPFIYVTNIN